MSYEDPRIEKNREFAMLAMRAAAEAERKGNPYMALAYLAVAMRCEEFLLEHQAR